MDAGGIDIDATTAPDRARSANDFLAHMISAHPTRFRGFMALHLQDVAAAAAPRPTLIAGPQAAPKRRINPLREMSNVGAVAADFIAGQTMFGRRTDGAILAL